MTKFLQTDDPELTFRLATSEDIDKIVKLVESAYRGEKSKRGWTTEADFIDGQRTDRQEVSELLSKPGSVFILCLKESELVGSVQLQNKESAGYLGMFAVAPELQSGGIGSQLLAQAEQFVAEEWSCVDMKMLVITIRQELIEWYEKKGYRRTGKFKPFPYYEPRFGLPRRDDLELEILIKSF